MKKLINDHNIGIGHRFGGMWETRVHKAVRMM